MNLKEKIINQIFIILTPLNLDLNLINKLKTDLLNDDLTSLNNFILTNYPDLSYSEDFKKLITSFVNKHFISSSYLTNFEEGELLSLEDNNIEKLRKVILNTQLNYLNNATSFIQELEKMDIVDLYNHLLNLNDIRYIQHSIANLNISTLNRLLAYIETIEKKQPNLINNFILEVIKRNLHLKQN